MLVMVMCLISVFMTAQSENGMNVAEGDFITFGSYEQDNNPDNGAEPIEWQVLKVEGDKALLLSRYGLDSMSYNTEYIDVTWENCSLRAWLNSEFVNAAFNADEQQAIILTNVDNGDAQGFDYTTVYDYAEMVTGGNDTQDMIFLLSYTEVNGFFDVTYRNDRNSGSRVAPTAYAKQKGAKTNTQKKTKEGKQAAWWWLRSPGSVQSYASYVSPDGSLSLGIVKDEKICVRPALWIDINQLFSDK